MTPQEALFKKVVHDLCARFERDGYSDHYPSPTNIKLALEVERGDKTRGRLNNLNGRQVRWRDEVFAERGWQRRLDAETSLRKYRPPSLSEIRRKELLA